MSKWDSKLAISFLRALEEQFQNEIPMNDMYFLSFDDPDRNTVNSIQEIETIDIPIQINSRALASEMAMSKPSPCKIF